MMNFVRALLRNTCNDFRTVFYTINRSSSQQTNGLVLCRFLSTDAEATFDKTKVDKKITENSALDGTTVESVFINRNPRNLEFLGIARKRKGWRFQYPTREYYHRLVFERTNRNITAYVEHCTGNTVVSASTKEPAILRHLHSATDVSAAENIGRVLAQRCRECGIYNMILHMGDNNESSEKFQAFHKAIIEGGIDLSEPEEVKAEYEPGIDYDNKEEVANLLQRQRSVYNLGRTSILTKFLKKKRKLLRRNRPLQSPVNLDMPSYTFT